MAHQIKLLPLASSLTFFRLPLMMELSPNTPAPGEPGEQLIEHIAHQNQLLELALDFGNQTRSMTTSTRWNSFRSEYPDVAIARRSAPNKFMLPSARCDGPTRISSKVPTVPT